MTSRVAVLSLDVLALQTHEDEPLLETLVALFHVQWRHNREAQHFYAVKMPVSYPDDPEGEECMVRVQAWLSMNHPRVKHGRWTAPLMWDEMSTRAAT